MVLMYILVGKN